MPELPEVETVRRGLAQYLVGKTVIGVKVENPKSFWASTNDISAFLYGATVTAVRRRAKVLMIDLSSNYTLLTHLKMTGQLVYVGADNERFGAGHPSDSLIGTLPDRSTRVVITFRDGSHLYFNDQRKFGWMKLLPPIAKLCTLSAFTLNNWGGGGQTAWRTSNQAGGSIRPRASQAAT